MWSLFMVFTLEGWPDIFRQARDSSESEIVEVLSFPFFLLYIIISSVVLLNLMTGMIIERVVSAADQQEQERCALIERGYQEHLYKLRTLICQMDSDDTGYLEWHEIEAALSDPVLLEAMEDAGVLAAQDAQHKAALRDLFRLADVDDSGKLDVETAVAMLVRCNHKAVSQIHLYEAVCMLRREILSLRQSLSGNGPRGKHRIDRKPELLELLLSEIKELRQGQDDIRATLSQQSKAIALLKTSHLPLNTEGELNVWSLPNGPYDTLHSCFEANT
mmetsp:Transcript_9622/g.20906  ORF Transcript_9622/g.20906 Transcript_9622/m.20906 type:complete len:275 (+) Transcript_9622:743-1567(+)